MVQNETTRMTAGFGSCVHLLLSYPGGHMCPCVQYPFTFGPCDNHYVSIWTAGFFNDCHLCQVGYHEPTEVGTGGSVHGPAVGIAHHARRLQVEGLLQARGARGFCGDFETGIAGRGEGGVGGGGVGGVGLCLPNRPRSRLWERKGVAPDLRPLFWCGFKKGNHEAP